jgi:competence protein ComEA
LLSGVASVIVVCVGGWWLLRLPPTPTEAELPFALTTHAVGSPTSALPAQATTTSGVTTVVVVHVAGQVHAPGVYSLRPGSRVVDALVAAGGAGESADTNALNLAAPINDGERVYVPMVGEAVAAPINVPAAGSAPPAGPVDLNRASAEQLDGLPGIGPSTAAAIVAHREQHGPFPSVDSLADVRGIGPAKLDALAGLVTV